MPLDSILQLIAQKFWVVLILYWLFLCRPYPIMPMIALVLAFVIATVLIAESEYFMGLIHLVLSTIHLLPGSEFFDAAEECEEGIHKAFIFGIYCTVAAGFIVLVIVLPIIQIKRGKFKYENKQAQH